jgi:ureidoacrylate peracid hydrolase
MDPRTTAILLIEYQNDFTSEGGTLHGAVKSVMDSTNMLANTVETVKQARALGATIIHAPISFAEDYRELGPNPYGILKGVVDGKSFRKGTWGAEIVDVLKPAPVDIVVEGKRRLCGFASTNLDFILRSRGVCHRARRFPHQLLRRIDNAEWLRARL